MKVIALACLVFVFPSVAQAWTHGTERANGRVATRALALSVTDEWMEPANFVDIRVRCPERRYSNTCRYRFTFHELGYGSPVLYSERGEVSERGRWIRSAS